ncbi:MAG: ATP-binding protein [Peptococcaceae bacterium]|nr:ATP-binding protein [Peptococcaceae bacterium]
MMAGLVSLARDVAFGGYDCGICGNRGIIVYEKPDGDLHAVRCECMDKRRMSRAVSETGLADKLDEQTQETFRAEKPWQSLMKKTSTQYLKDFDKAKKKWFYVGGSPGTGKTHLCTSMVGEFLKLGYQAKYMIWGDEVGRLKRIGNDPEYDMIIREFKNVPVLYVDDFLKTTAGEKPTAAEIKIGFEIVNARYNNPAAITILSSERSTDDICELDKGLGGRIIERAKPFVMAVYPGQDMRTGA